MSNGSIDQQHERRARTCFWKVARRELEERGVRLVVAIVSLSCVVMAATHGTLRFDTSSALVRVMEG